MTPQEALDKLNVFINHPSTGDDNEADAIEAIGVLQGIVSSLPADPCAWCAELLSAESINGGRCLCCGAMILPKAK